MEAVIRVFLRTVATTPRRMPEGALPEKVREFFGIRTATPLPDPYSGTTASLPPAHLPAPQAGARALAANLPANSVVTVPPAPPVHVPHGYRRAWDDGRLNPYAGKQTFTGALQTAQVWTQTVPRRLKTNDARDVTSQNNYVVYPIQDYTKPRALLGSGARVVVQTTAGPISVPASQAHRWGY